MTDFKREDEAGASKPCVPTLELGTETKLEFGTEAMVRDFGTTTLSPAL